MIASGGVGIARRRRGRSRDRGLGGVITGKALYEGRFTVAEALAGLQVREMRWPRVIPCLDVNDGRVVKGVNFVDLRDAGDPVELAARYDAEGADELVFLDITASSDGRDTMVDVVRRTAEQVFIPFTVGGGIRAVDDARRMLRAGADKVSVNTAAVQRPELIAEIATEFGAQCVRVRHRRQAPAATAGSRSTCTAGARRPGSTRSTWAGEAARLGAGEILLTSMDRDGTKDGFDLELTAPSSTPSACRSSPAAASGTLEHLVEGVHRGRRRRRAGGVDLPLRRAHRRRGQGGDGRRRHHRAPVA